MNKTKKKIIGIGMILFLGCFMFAEEQIVIESKLFRGLNKVFQIPHIDHLISGNMIWDGERGILEETFSFDEFSYPIQFSPQVISENSVNLKIEMFREKKTEKLLDTEIVVNFDKPVIFGFPINGNTYFLSINLTRGGAAVY